MSVWQQGMTLEDVERETIQEAMRVYQGNKSATARSLNIAVRTLDNKLSKYAAEEAALAEQEKIQSEKRRRDQLAQMNYDDEKVD